MSFRISKQTRQLGLFSFMIGLEIREYYNVTVRNVFVIYSVKINFFSFFMSYIKSAN
jgi:hypothetical protein